MRTQTRMAFPRQRIYIGALLEHFGHDCAAGFFDLILKIRKGSAA